MLTAQAIHLLLFSECGLSFGASAGQVKELLRADSLVSSEDSNFGRTVRYKGEELRIFRLSSRLRLRKHLEKNREFLCCDDLKAKEKAAMLEREGSAELEPSARILVVGHGDEGEIGIYVEYLKQLSLVPLSQIFRLPLLMEKTQQLQSVWGLALIDERPVVLVDLENI